MGETLPPQWRRNLIQVVPMVITLALIMLGAAPAQSSAAVPVTPMLALMSIYYWSVYRPEWLSAPVVFFLGVIADCLLGGPLGLNAILYLFAYGITTSQRLILQSRPFRIAWLAFGMVTVTCTALSWAIGCLFYGNLFDPLPFAVQALLTILLFPLVARAFIWTEVRLARLA